VRKKLSCGEIGIDCSYMVTATNEELLMQTALKHISEFTLENRRKLAQNLKQKWRRVLNPNKELYGFVR
jgi:predicted small metal-binding protein